MILGFSVNTLSAWLIIAAVTAVNLFAPRKRPLRFPVVALGASLCALLGVFGFYLKGSLGESPGTRLAVTFILFTTLLTYVNFLYSLTRRPRPSWFPYTFALPIPPAVAAAIFYHPLWYALVVLIALLALIPITLIFLYLWIRKASDERARRDGQWVLLFFFMFILGFLVSISRSYAGSAWVFALWFLVIHIAVRHLRILERVTSLENQLIMDNIFDVVIILDAFGKIVQMNRRGYKLTGFSPITVEGSGIEALVIHPELNAANRAAWLGRLGANESWSSGGRSPSIDASLVTSSYEGIPVDLRVIRLTDLAGECTGFVISATDMRITRQLIKEISDREYAARDLALSESKFQRMFLFNPAGILIVEMDTLLITDANPAAEEIFERESKFLDGHTLAEVGLELIGMSPEGFLERVQMEGSIPELPARIKNGAEQVLSCRVSAVMFDLNSSNSMLLSVRDVTHEEQMVEALTRKQKVETIGTLAGGIAHDFNNILAAILGHIGLARLKIKDPALLVPVERAEQACLRAREMTGQLLAFSRGGKPVIGVCETRHLIIESSMLAVEHRETSCMFNIEREIWPLKVDRIQVGQVISNLVGNAVDAMPGGGYVSVSAKNRDFRSVPRPALPLGTDSQPIPPGRYVEIAVRDRGSGIPPGIRGKIFDPFFTTKEKGTGLGLSIVYSIVQNHRGAVHLESAIGRGTTFTLHFPAAEEEELEGGTCAIDSDTASKKVLLMDDEAMVRETASEILSLLGYSVVLASDGEEAVSLYRDALEREEPFAFCVFDLVVPGGMSGTAAAKGVLALDPGALLIVSSGYSDDPVLSNVREWGFQGAILKPYTVEEFKTSLTQILNQ